jgi:hypothetical protein
MTSDDLGGRGSRPKCPFLIWRKNGHFPHCAALASVPDTINCRILISEYVHVHIISSRCRHHRSCNQHFSLNGDITEGGHPSKYWLSRCCCPSVLEIEGTGVSTSLGRWLWNLVCFVWSDNLVSRLRRRHCGLARHFKTDPTESVALCFEYAKTLFWRRRHCGLVRHFKTDPTKTAALCFGYPKTLFWLAEGRADEQDKSHPTPNHPQIPTSQ